MSNSILYRQSEKSFSKRRYPEVLNFLIPSVYKAKDLELSGSHKDPIVQVINGHIKAADAISSILFISSVPNTAYAHMSAIEGISPFFSKRNNLAVLTTDNFERNILNKLNRSLKEFATSGEFKDYLENTLFSSIRLNSPIAQFDSASPSANHIYLIQNLGWVYFLNTGRAALDYQPSTLSIALLTDKIYRGQTVKLEDGVNAFSEFLWRNYEACASFRSYIPTNYEPSAYVNHSSSATYASGLENLNKYKILVDIIYSTDYANLRDFLVDELFEAYIYGKVLANTETPQGPFHKFLKAIAYSIADIDSKVESLNILYDIEQCPDNLLPEIAKLIGWKLYGTDPNRWRLQLYNAVQVYKAAGTKRSIQLAVDSIFSKEVFNVSSQIFELWESYIPYLAYYSLATESPLFESFSSIPPIKAKQLGMDTYSLSSIDENIKIAVDTILLQLVQEFPDSFYLGGKRFPVGDPNFVFFYRGRNFIIPPWEEIPYYANVHLSERIIRSFVDKLACFGVRKAFALQVGDYIRTNTVHVNNDLQIDNGFLFFTSGYQQPPNWGDIILSATLGKDEYLSLWNGKSSHFKLLFQASSFDFEKDSLEVDSGLAPQLASRAANDFAPAHAIPKVSLLLGTSDVNTVGMLTLPILDFLRTDTFYNTASSTGFAQAESIGSLMPSSFSRAQVKTTHTATFQTTASIEHLRYGMRRRNFKHALPSNLYTRTGFNAPLTFDASVLEHSLPSSLGYIPLGYIPSAGKFEPIPNISSIPDVYSRCNTLNSSATYYGYPISATFPCRGRLTLRSNQKRGDTETDLYQTRGATHQIYGVFHDLMERTNYASAYEITKDASAFVQDFYWKNWTVSYANSAILASGWAPSTLNDYYNYSISRGVHKLYHTYLTDFQKHALFPDPLDGSSIFSHIYGSICENSTFEHVGTGGNALYASSIEAVTGITPATDYLSAPEFGGYQIGLNDDVIALITTGTIENRSHEIIKEVELIQTSGSSSRNTFEIYRLANAFATTNPENNYVINNTLVKHKAVDGLSRIKFGFDYYDTSKKNFLVPEHKFALSLKAVAGKDNGTTLGGSRLGIWIHTNNESGMVWSYTPKGQWVLNHITDLTIEYILQNLTTYYTFREKPFSLLQSNTGENPYKCIDLIDNPSRGIIRSLIEKDFENLTIEFNTLNKLICVPERYYKVYGQVHRLTQNYNINMFMIPDRNADKFVIFDHISLHDKTLREFASIKVGGTPTPFPFKEPCDSTLVEIREDQLFSIFRFFKSIAPDTLPTILSQYLGRDWPDFDGDSISDGGSRLNYRLNPEWLPNGKVPGFASLSAITLDN